MPDPRLRRTMLMTPGNREDRLRKAAAYGADALVYDLEDSVPPAEKAHARRCMAAVLGAPEAPPAAGLDPGPHGVRGDREPPAGRDQRGRHPDGLERCVRINALDTPYGADDLAALPFDRIDSVMVPKVESADMLREVDARLSALHADRGRDRPIELIALIETPRGVLRALDIADAVPRTTALFFGSGDYTSALGAEVTDATLHYPRSVIAAAAAAAGMQAIDAAFFGDVRNAQATRQDALAARAMGYAGKVVFHPNQVDVVNDVFSPSPAEIARAQRLIAAYEAQLALGHGTSAVDGLFVAVDLVAPARRLLRLAETLRQRAGGRPPASTADTAASQSTASTAAGTAQPQSIGSTTASSAQPPSTARHPGSSS
ncbi:HpcH/HpaI aldolase/citrate lyase family protein [Bordetella sp. H567]|uniref:HpcH/HpaI aldolase/citrate lyase family protein n=1 Tax=Bordetella sp. H567 TaxID=1697043 RepID=UPI000832743B|nr:CoA ester lyase [Bordetella sp. H567]